MASLLSFDRGWQEPARTEAWAFESSRDRLVPSPFLQYFGFPWATLIDLESRGRHEDATIYREALGTMPPRMTLVRATVCQHIWMPRLLEEFRQLNITDIFWPHARLDEVEMEGIRIHPFPLYPVQQASRRADFAERPRDLLYSFAGAYDPGLYLSGARQWIFDLPPRSGAIITRRPEWHFEQHVYGQGGMSGSPAGEEAGQPDAAAREFSELLSRSIFSLCPSGSGPNTIRFWESLGAGSIPVLISDRLKLPGDASLWDDAIVRVQETAEAVSGLPDLLETMASDPGRIDAMRAGGARAWQAMIVHGPETLIGELTDPANLDAFTR